MIRLFFLRNFALLSCLLDHADEHVFEREAAFLRAQNAYSEIRQNSCRIPYSLLCAFVCDDVKTVAKQRYTPPFKILLQRIGRILRLVHGELKKMPFLAAFDLGVLTFGHKFACDHEAKTIA